jgi:hypothetical protein
MEKISHIVRTNPRVASVDLKGAAPARAGAPSFGRPVTESSAVRNAMATTAERASALHNEMTEAKKVMSSDRTISNLADQFFMSRVRRPEEMQAQGPGASESASASVHDAPADEPTLSSGPADETVEAAYTPRGSFVDVRA